MLKERIKQDLKKAQKERREIEVLTLRMILASIINKEKEKRYKIAKEKPELTEQDLEKESQLAEEEIIDVLFSEAKKRKESILEFEKGERQDLAEKEKTELEILKKYLPEQASEEEIRNEAQKVIKELSASEIKDMGRVMGQLMPKLKGKAQGDVVSKIVKEILIQKDN